MDKINEILDFWFEGVTDEVTVSHQAMPFKKWFMKDKNMDEEIRRRFESDLKKARQGECKSWEDSMRGRLALIILYDQFTRNMYRDTPDMYTADPLAIELVLRSIEEGKEKELSLIERVFLYMPLMHSEELKVQDACVECFERQVEESEQKTPHNTFYYKSNLDYAKKHRDVVEKFSRFPHRNSILSRTSTPEEEEFLKKPGSSF